MVELERVRLLQMLRVDLKLRVICGKGIKNLRVTALGPRGLEDDLSMIASILKNVCRKLLSFGERSLHEIEVGVTRVAVRTVRSFHRATAKMLLVAGRAGEIARHIRLVKIMVRMTSLAGLIDSRHRFFVRLQKF